MKFTSILTYGFAIFAMFFGSGNLVFPVQIGLLSGAHWAFGFLGLLLTGIMLPFLGLFVIKLNRGDFFTFFAGAGKLTQTLLPLFTLSLLGSFGVIPRCITVAHGGISAFSTSISLVGFSVIFSLITYFLCLKDQRMVSIIGRWMSPILLITLIILIICGIIQAPAMEQAQTSTQAFSYGFLTGYQTMDLFAAFFFSAFIFKQMHESLPQNTSNRRFLLWAILPGIVGSLLLALVYVGFVYLGAHYALIIQSSEPELMLPTIATAVMGRYASACIAIAMVFSCLTTAVALNSIYARYLCTFLKNQERHFPWMLGLTTIISFVVSLLDFRGIAAFLAPMLEFSYPGLIALTATSIIAPKNQLVKTCSFWGVTTVTLAFKLIL